MHSIVLLTALTATSGLFGGGRQCGGGYCGRPAQAYYTYAPRHYTYQYQQTYAPCAARVAAPAPQAQVAAPQAAPAPQAAAPAAPVARSYYNAAYYHPGTASCPSGTCPYR